MKKAKKIILTVSISVVCVVCALAVLAYSLLAFGPIEWETGACGGGFGKFVADTNQSEISELVGHPITEDQCIQIGAATSIDGWYIHTHFIDNSKEVKLVAKKTYVFPFSSTLVWSLDES